MPEVSSITDNGATHATYTNIDWAQSGNNDRAEVWYASNIPAGISSVTINLSFVGTPDANVNTSVWVGEYSGLAVSAPLDRHWSQYNPNTNQHGTGSTALTSAPNELVFAAYEDFGNGDTVTTPTGWNVRLNDSPNNLDTLVTLDENGTEPTNYSANFTTNAFINSDGVIATFKPAVAATNVITNASYSGTDQLTSKTEVSGSTTLASWTNIAYDMAQNRTAETLTYYTGNPYPDPQASTATYRYDTVNQLSQDTIPGKTAANFGYDAAHNLTSNGGTAQAYNNNESLQTVGTTTVGADADGNELNDVSGHSLSWNSLSQLEKFSTTEVYTYDALGRLTTIGNGTSVTAQFVYRGMTNQVVEELNGSGGVVRSYAYDSTGRQLYAKVGGTTYYEITDPHGDVAALATSSAIAGTEHFDPWGNLLNSSGMTTPFGFQGADGSWTDAATGFVYMSARWYYPKVGRFLSSDPAAGTADPRTPIDEMRWLYGQNGPLTRDDPTGLRFVIDDGGWGGGSSYQAPAPAVDYYDRIENIGHAAAEASARAENQRLAAEAAAAASERRQQNIVQHSQGSAPAQHGAGPSWLVINGYDVGQHFGNAANHIANDQIKPDYSQLTWQNFGNAAAGWADEGVGGVIDLGCMAQAIDVCDMVDPTHQRDRLVSNTINALGGHVDQNSDAYRDGRIAFVVASVVAGAPGLIRSAPSLVRAGLSLFRAAPEVSDVAPSVSTAIVPYDPEFAAQQGTRLLQSVANEYRSSMGANPMDVRNLLSADERAAMQSEPWLQRPMVGKAIERAVAADPRISGLFEHLGGASEGDFQMGQYVYELTTSNPATVAAHLARPYVNVARLITYEPWKIIAGL